MIQKRVNPFKPIYDVCNRGNSLAKLQSLPSFPRYLDLELTNTCNFRCLMCPAGVGSVSRAKGFMSGVVFQKLIDEIAPHKTPLRFIRWGEPMLHPEFIQYIRKAKNVGALVHINTNGSLLNEEMIACLLDTRLDSIKFSFQGVDRQGYHEMRNIDYFDDLLRKVKMLYEKRGNRPIPFIHVSTTITYETVEQVRLFRDSIKNHVDLVTVGRTVLEHIRPDETNLDHDKQALLTRLKTMESVVKKHPDCPEVFDKLSVNWDGTVSACCSDYDNKMLVGDLTTTPLSEIWMSTRMNRYRTMLAGMRHDDIPLCSTCYDYHELQTPGLQQVIEVGKTGTTQPKLWGPQGQTRMALR